ncbi:MAG TPA: alpha/beta hydrolase-fold protein [Candidatus Acidoferrum sp.]|jgi:predicted alpha/beta superfamily hydrolase
MSFRKHERFPSQILRNERDLIVYLPPGYEDQPGRRFPVLYLNDGQNLFDASTSFVPGMYWRVGETADLMITQGLAEPLIIVGIYNTGKHRIREYTPSRAPKLGGGSANRYAQFLIEEVKGFIDHEYRTLGEFAHTGLGGSSLGGLVSLFVALKFSGVYSKVAALSPSVWWDQRILHRFAETVRIRNRSKIWLDIGTGEGGQIVRDVQDFRDVLFRRGWQQDRDLHFELVEDAEHNEGAWAQRIGAVLQFLFPV